MAKRTKHADPSLFTDTLYRTVSIREVAKEILPRVAPLRLPGTIDDVVRMISAPAWIDARLAAVPGVALGVLEILVEASGAISRKLLGVEAKRRLGLDEARLDALLRAMQDELLSVSLEVQTRMYLLPTTEVVLYEEMAPHIAARVGGVTLPAPPPASDLEPPAQPDSTLRDVVALLATSAHVPLRVNKNASVNMTSCKKLAVLLGRPEQEVASQIDLATNEGLLGAQGALLAPLLAPLRALASGARPWAATSEVTVVTAWVPADRWIAREALVRAHVAHASQTMLDEYIDLFVLRRRAEATIDQLPVAKREHDGHVFLRRVPSGALRGSGDGHVTPSFEVMLGPAADPELTLTIALATEPVRFDRVLTRRITPASISSALALGVTAKEIEDALERVGRHGVPDNVRAMVADWAKGARTATLRQVTMVETSSADAADAAARALGSKVVARPSPTLLLVDGPQASLESALVKAGVRVTGTPQPLVDGAAHGVHALLGPPPWLGAEADPALRARARDLGGIEVERDFGPAQALRAAAKSHAGPPRRFLELAAKLWAAATDELFQWAQALPEDDGVEALDHAMTVPLDFWPWIVRTPRDRKRVLGRVKSLEELLLALHAGAPPAQSLTVEGRELMRLIGSRDVLAALGRPAEPTSGSAPEPPLAAGARPRAQDLPPQDRDALRRMLDEAIAAQRALWVRVASKSQGERVVSLTPERVLSRGSEVTLLGTDVESGDGRSFPLSNVVAVRPHA